MQVTCGARKEIVHIHKSAAFSGAIILEEFINFHSLILFIHFKVYILFSLHISIDSRTYSVP